VTGVEEQNEEVLTLLLAELRAHKRNNVIGPTDLARLLAAVFPPSQLADVHRASLRCGKEKGLLL
jgi:hypothetical protein